MPGRNELWVRAEADAGTFAAAPVVRGGRRAGQAAAAAGVAFLALSGAASLAFPDRPAPDGAVPAVVTGTTPAGAALVSPSGAPPGAIIQEGWPPSRAMGDAFVPVRLEQPMPGAKALTEDAIDVLGQLRIHAASVRVSLQTLDQVTLDSTVVRTSNVDGGIRPLHAPRIDVRLSIPTPRPTGEQLWIVVTAYNDEGRPLGGVRRVVTVGELAEAD